MATAAPTLLIVDGSSLLHRAYHALPTLTAPDGRLVNAVYGFLAMFFKGVAELRPTHIAVTFDRPEPTFRNQLFPAYQAQREEKPDELYAQIPIITEILGTLHVPVYAIPGYEADDVIGTIVEKVAGHHTRVVVLTGDKDLLQLVREGVDVVLFRRGMTDTARYDTAAVIERFGFPPERIPDFKALAGDPSDNYPGVPGVGEKTATELVRAFGGVGDILKAASAKRRLTPLSEKLAARFQEHAEVARLGLRLATIVRDVPVEFRIADCARGQYDRDAVVAKLRALGFHSLLSRLPAASEVPDTTIGQTVTQKISAETFCVTVLSETSAVRGVFTQARRQPSIAVAAIARGDDVRRDHPLALGLAWDNRAVGVHPWGTALAEGAAVLRDRAIAKDAHDAKQLLHALRRSRIDLAGLRYDTALLSYLLAPGSRSHDLAHVAFAELGVEVGGPLAGPAALNPHRARETARGGGPPLRVTRSRTATDESSGGAPGADVARAGHEAAIVQQLVPILAQKIEEAGLMRVYEEFERPLVPVLQRMEEVGIRLDVDHLTSLGAEMRSALSETDAAITTLAGHAFNVDSPAQLKTVLFEELGIAARGVKRTVKGRTLSTAAAELEKLRGGHPIIESILRHRELRKLLSTYVDALPALVDPTTGRIHTTYHQTVTATGRLSSSDPNLQNIPVTEPWGPTIRRAFVAEEGRRLLAIDYSQFELRIAATLSGDRALQAAFRAGRDIHAATGSEIFGVPEKEVTRDQRRVAKAINFGILYGMGPGALAATAAISREEAEEYIRRYFQVYGGLKEWIDTTIAIARTRGYVETLFGRKRFLPELTSGVPQVRAAAERMAVNMPIQGTQADLLKRAMIRADEWIRATSERTGDAEGGSPTARRSPSSTVGVRSGRTRSREDAVRMVLTVHDELVFEVREEFLHTTAAALTEILEGVEHLAVPIVVEAKVGRSWGELAPVRTA